jgi:glycosyltransferase involved in cell wall biosynthesis
MLENVMNISVAMATYNGDRYLAQQLESIRAQTLLPRELVVSDDGSTDATLDIVNHFAKTAPFPVTILKNEKRLGFADNFLRAAEACGQPLIAFADQDDVWLPEKLRHSAERLTADHSLLAMHSLTVTDGELSPTGFQLNQGIVGDVIYDPLQLDPFGTGWGNTMLLRREVVHLIPRESRPLQPGNPNRQLSHDTWVYVLSAALGRVSHIVSPQILYRQHANNASGRTERVDAGKFVRLMKVPIIEYREHAKFDKWMVQIFTDLGKQGGEFASLADSAAQAFTKRAAYWSSRVATFDNPTLWGRLQAYRHVRAITAHSPLWIGSRAKDLVLGVFRIGATPLGAPLLRDSLPCGR